MSRLAERPVWRDLAVVALLILAVSIFHWRGLAPGSVFVDVGLAHNQLPWGIQGEQPVHNWLLSDPIWQSYPFIAHAIGPEGNSLWNPDIFLGHPRFADPLAQPYYPVFRMLARDFGPARGFTFSLWLHVVWAAVSMAGFLRAFGVSRKAALFGALTYALGGYLVTWLEYTHRTGTLAWLPAVLWTYELAVKRRDPRFAALSAICLGIAVLNGQFQFVGAFLLLMGLFALCHALGYFPSDNGRRSVVPLLQFGFVAAVGLALGAVLLLPFASYLGDTHRAEVAGLGRALAPAQLLTLLVPDFFGNPTMTDTYWGSVNYGEDTIYTGVIALLLAAAAPLQTRRRSSWALAAVTLVIVYFIVGGPGVRAIGRAPFLAYLSLGRAVFLLPILVGMLAAEWLDTRRTVLAPILVGAAVAALVIMGAVMLDLAQVRSHISSVRAGIATSLILMAVLVILVALRKRWPHHSGYIEWALVVLLFVDLALWGARYNSVGKASDLYPATPDILQLEQIAPEGRVAAIQSADSPLFGFNVLPLFGFSEPGGYSSLVPARLQEVFAAGDPKAEAEGVAQYLKSNGNIVFFSQPSVRLLDLLHVTHLLSPEDLPLDNEGMEYEAISCETVSDEISGGTVVSGTFTVLDTAINRLDLQFHREDSQEPQGELLIRMWRRDAGPVLMFEERYDPAALSDRDVATFYFAPEQRAPGHRYEVQVSAVDGDDTNVRLCMNNDGFPSLAAAGVDWHQLHSDGFYTYERAAPLPRAYVAYNAQTVATPEQMVATLLDASSDLRNVGYIEPEAVSVLELGRLNHKELPATQAEVVDEQPGRIVVQTNAQAYGMLILTERYHPGWRARVDGKPAAIHPVNHLYRGVALEPGEHEIVFTFQPRSLYTGAGVSLGALLVCVAVIAWNTRRRRRAVASSVTSDVVSSPPPL